MRVPVPADDRGLEALCNKIERERGFFCSSYKDTCLARRISVRMRTKGAAGFAEYENILDNDAEEYGRLIATLTVNVAKFFRNPEPFVRIAAKVIPALWIPAVHRAVSGALDAHRVKKPTRWPYSGISTQS